MVSKYLNKIPLPPAVAVPIQRIAFSIIFSVATTGIVTAVRIHIHGRHTMKYASGLFNTWQIALWQVYTILGVFSGPNENEAIRLQTSAPEDR